MFPSDLSERACLERATCELVRNSLDKSEGRESPEVIISCHRGGVRIRDNGPGMTGPEMSKYLGGYFACGSTDPNRRGIGTKISARILGRVTWTSWNSSGAHSMTIVKSGTGQAERLEVEHPQPGAAIPAPIDARPLLEFSPSGTIVDFAARYVADDILRAVNENFLVLPCPVRVARGQSGESDLVAADGALESLRHRSAAFVVKEYELSTLYFGRVTVPTPADLLEHVGIPGLASFSVAYDNEIFERLSLKSGASRLLRMCGIRHRRRDVIVIVTPKAAKRDDLALTRRVRFDELAVYQEIASELPPEATRN